MNRLLMCALIASVMASFAGEPKPAVPPVPNPPKAGDPQPPPPKPPIEPVKEEELQRSARVASTMFPWKENPPPKPPPKPAQPGDPTSDSGVPDLTSGEIIIKSSGDFSREEKDGKEILILNQDVEIEQLQSQSVLRGQTIKVIRDIKTGQTEWLEANGGVEVVTPERKGRGEHLVYETQYGPQGQILKDLYTIEGDQKKGIRAILWQGDDVIEAERFVNDRKMDTFRVTGAPQAIITPPADPNQPPAGTPAKPGGTGSGTLTGFGASSGGKIRMKCDGEMFYEGATGRAHITRNVFMQQDGIPPDPGMLMIADEAYLTMLLPPPGQPSDNTTVFSGSLKTLESLGRVEIRTGTQNVLCDRGLLDMQKHTFLMEMKNPKDMVLVFMLDKAMKIMAPRNLIVNMETNEFHSSSALKMEGFTGTPPTNRGTGPAPGSIKIAPPPPPSTPIGKKSTSPLSAPKAPKTPPPNPAIQVTPKNDGAAAPATKTEEKTPAPPKKDESAAPAQK